MLRKSFVLLALLALPACGGFPWPIPGPTPTPTPTPTPAPPSPVCQPPDLVTSCWHQPPGSPWLYICPGGSPQVSDPKECPTVVPGEPPQIVDNRWAGPEWRGTTTTHHGWPYCDADCTTAIKAGGHTHTEWRIAELGDDRPGYEPFLRVPGQTSSAWRFPGGQEAVLGILAARSKEEAQAAILLNQALHVTPAQRLALRRGVQLPAEAPVWDLTKYNPAHDAMLEALLKDHHEKGITILFGLEDAWIKIHREEFPTPWRVGMNVQGVDLMRPDDVQGPLQPLRRAFLEHELSIILRYPNVVLQLGNEAYRLPSSEAFVNEVRGLVRTVEAKHGYKRHPWSPGSLGDRPSALGSEYDFKSAHGLSRPAEGVPVQVDEYAPIPCATYLQRLAQAKAAGTYYALWHDDNPSGGSWEDPAWEEDWPRCMAQATGTLPTTGCSTVPNEDAIKVEPRPASRYHEQVNKVHLALNPMCASAFAVHQARLKRQAVSGVVEAEGVGERCDIPMQANTYRLAFAQRAREMFPDLCTGIQTDSEGPVDEVSMGSRQEAQNYHVFACKKADCPPEHPDCGCDSGTVAWAPGSVRDTWRGPTGPEPQCAPAVSRLSGMAVMSHVGNRFNINVTPQFCGADWCNANGFPGRQCCPLGQEGSDQRLQCELALVGDTTWTPVSGAFDRMQSQGPPGGLGAVWVKPEFTAGRLRACAIKAPAICSELDLP